MLRKYKLTKKEWRIQEALGLLKTYAVHITGKRLWVRRVRAFSEDSAICEYIESMERENYYMGEVKGYTVKLID